MSLAWHIARNDLRRLRWPIVAWIVVIAAKLGLGVLLVLGVGADQSLELFETLSVASRAMPVLEALLGYGLVASVVHGDLMLGTTAFWMTRPVSGARMLAGKAMGLAVIFGVVPIALTLPWWVGCGYGFREVIFGAGETLLWQGLVVLVAVPLATLTDGLPRFLLWSVVVAGVLVGLSVQIPGHPGLLQVAIAVLVFVAGCGVSSSTYFLTRRYLASVAILGVSAALAFGAAAWPGRFSVPARWVEDERPGPVAPNVELIFREARVRLQTGPNSDLNVWFQVKGVPPELILGGRSENLWTWPSPLVLKREGEVGDLDQGASWIALGLKPPHSITHRIARMNDWRAQQGLADMVSRGSNGIRRLRRRTPWVFRTGAERSALVRPAREIGVGAPCGDGRKTGTGRRDDRDERRGESHRSHRRQVLDQRRQPGQILLVFQTATRSRDAPSRCDAASGLDDVERTRAQFSGENGDFRNGFEVVFLMAAAAGVFSDRSRTRQYDVEWRKKGLGHEASSRWHRGNHLAHIPIFPADGL